MSTVVGIDPGLQGAIAFLDVRAWTIRVFDMPTFTVTKTKTKNHVDAIQLANLLDSPSLFMVYVEAVTSSPQMGVVSAFSFGEGLGIIKGVAGALQLPINLVAPNKWKRRMQCPADKTEARARARQLFPSCEGVFDAKKDDGRAEACIIALYGALDQNHKPTSAVSVVLG